MEKELKHIGCENCEMSSSESAPTPHKSDTSSSVREAMDIVMIMTLIMTLIMIIVIIAITTTMIKMLKGE